MNNLFLAMYVKLQDLMNREEGQDLIEYALLLSLIALVSITLVGALGNTVSSIYTKMNTQLG